MPLTLHAAIRLLSDHDLLSKVVRGTGLAQDIPDDPAADVRFSSITYDTRTVGDGSLLVRKGRFRPAYLATAWTNGDWPPTWPKPGTPTTPTPRD